MPPAFNLSQDQTLQFNLCCLAFLPPSLRTGRSHNFWRTLLAKCRNSFLWTFDNLSNQRPKSLAPSSNAHTYRLLIFKELYSVLLAACWQSVLFVSREEERVWSVWRCSSTSFFALFLQTVPSHLVATCWFVAAICWEANYSKRFQIVQEAGGNNATNVPLLKITVLLLILHHRLPVKFQSLRAII